MMELKAGDRVYSIKNSCGVTYIITNIVKNRCDVVTDDESQIKYGNVDLRLFKLVKEGIKCLKNN